MICRRQVRPWESALCRRRVIRTEATGSRAPRIQQDSYRGRRIGCIRHTGSTHTRATGS